MRCVDVGRTLSNPEVRPEDPFYYGDQDVLNALIGTAIPQSRFEIAETISLQTGPSQGFAFKTRTRLLASFRTGTDQLSFTTSWTSRGVRPSPRPRTQD